MTADQTASVSASDQAPLAEALGALFCDAALLFGKHGSAIGHALADGLGDLRTAAIEQPPASVPACSALSEIEDAPHGALVARILDVSDRLHWRVPGFGRLTGEVATGLAVTELAGPHGMIRDTRLRFGLLLQCAGHVYPDHRHAAEELYVVLSGRARWSVDGLAGAEKEPGAYVHHKPLQPHRIETGMEPLLAMWGWVGDLDAGSYSL